ncbi:DUF401 family protein [Thermodesulfobacteriota bacterium]
MFSIFALVLVLIRLRLHLSLALFLGAIILGLWMGLGPVPIIHSVLQTITGLQTISLVLIVALILIMSRIMKDAGHMDRLVSTFSRISRDARLVGSVMSALIGLLPMPGGALFSAPLVETSLNNHSITGEQKTVVNYWFRHIWEYWWPLYPGVVLAVALLEVDTWSYIAVMAPMTLLSILAGFLFIIRPMETEGLNHRGGLSWPAIGEFLWEMMPILIVVLVIIALPGLIKILDLIDIRLAIPGAISILPGLLASIIWVCIINHVSFEQLRAAVTRGKLPSMLLLIIAIMVFQGVMMRSGAVLQIRNELVDYNIPVLLVIMIMPFISGLTTGIAIGFVGTSFPLIIPMFPTSHPFDYMLWAALAYIFGYMGMMLSPVHLCFLVSKDYFHAGLLSSYRILIWPVLMIMFTAIVLFFLVRTFY